MRNYRDLSIWVKSHQLNLTIRKNIVQHLPSEEKFVLGSQLSRAVLSVPLNIVEGCSRDSKKDFVRFLEYSIGSLLETQYCCLLAKELNYISIELFNEIDDNITQLLKMINSFIQSLKQFINEKRPKA